MIPALVGGADRVADGDLDVVSGRVDAADARRQHSVLSEDGERVYATVELCGVGLALTARRLWNGRTVALLKHAATGVAIYLRPAT